MHQRVKFIQNGLCAIGQYGGCLGWNNALRSSQKKSQPKLFFKLSEHGARGRLADAQVLGRFMQVAKFNKMLHQNQMSKFEVR
jgi:hypothetical protein